MRLPLPSPRRLPGRLPLAAALALAFALPAHAADSDADIQKKGVTALDAMSVTASTATGYTTDASSSATGLDLSLKETPQSISVITRQQMDDQQIETIYDALTSTTGITSNALDNSGRTNFRARGFAITNYKVDGMLVDGTTSFSGAGASLNMDLYDSVQVVRGANGLMGGTGDPSATIYLQRKAPTRTFGGSVSVTAGSWDKRRAMGDVNIPLTASGSVRARVVVTGEDSGSFRDRESLQSNGALVNLAADLSSTTTLTVGAQYERTRNGGGSWGANVPIWYADGSRTNLPRSTNPVTDWSVSKRDATTLFATLEQALPGDWHAKLGVSRTDGDAYANAAVAKVNNSRPGFGGFWNQNGTGAFLNGIHSEYEARRDNIDLSVSGPVELFGRQHELIAGFNGYRDEQTNYTFSNALGNCNIAGVAPYSGCQYRAIGLPIANWQTWDGSYADFNTHRTYARTVDHVSNYGGYIAGRFNLADGLHAVVGTRLGNYRLQTDTYNVSDARTRAPATGDQQVWTPYAGLLYDIGTHLTAYGSYTRIFTPQGDVRDESNTRLDPVTGNSYELGLKGEWFDGALNSSVALFRNQQNNVAEATGATNLDTGEAIYRAVSGVTSKGVDLEVSGQLAEGWNLYAGYTHLTVRGLSYQQDPRNLFRLNTAYTLPGSLHRLTVGGGISVQGPTEWSTNPGRPLGNGRYDASNLRVGGYTLVNLMARYDVTERLQAALNVSNATDKVYYQQFGFYDGLIYGTPRATTLTVRYRF